MLFNSLNNRVLLLVRVVQKHCFLSNLGISIPWSRAKTELKLKVRGKAVNEREFIGSLVQDRKAALMHARAQVRSVFNPEGLKAETIAQVTKSKLIANYVGDYRI